MTVEHSRIDGADSFGDGLVYSVYSASGPNTVTIRYTFVGANGFFNSFSGTATCLAITQASSFTDNGCPAPPAALAGAVRTYKGYKN